MPHRTILIRLQLICALLFLAKVALCQVTISGKVQSDKGEGLGKASISLEEKSTNKIIKYAISDDKGNFAITINSTDTFFIISIKKLNYEFVTQQIKNETASYNFVLAPKVTTLKEVVVKNTAIRQKGDTLSYSVNAFADQKDRSIGDVIAKLPGVEVQPDGKILYQGKPIQKYYIDGMDLLEGKYNLANNNLPFQAVTSVQILENHQPIRVLDSLVPSDRASLNIKLKNPVTVSGSLKAGIGASPLLWDVNLSPMVFNRKLQFIGSYQTNNVGVDVSRELKTLTVENLMEQLENNTDKKDLVEIVALKTPPVSTKRFLDNNSHMITGNFLRKLKQDMELRLNVSYINDYVKQNGQNTTEYFLPTGNVDFNEWVSNKYFSNELRADFTLQKNTPKSYFKNSLRTLVDLNLNRGAVVNNSANVSQQVNTRYRVFSNQFKWITKLGKQLITISSFTAYSRGPQDLYITPGQFMQVLNSNVPFENLQQNTQQEIFQTNNYLEFTKGLGKVTLMAKTGFKYQQQNTNTSILKETVSLKNEFENNINNKLLKLFVTPSFTYKEKSIRANVQMPISMYSLSVSDKMLLQSQQKDVLAFDPTVSVSYDVNNYWQLAMGGAYSNSFQDYDRIFYGYLLQNYRTLMQNNFPIAQNKTVSLNNGIYYRHALKSIFFNLSGRYSATERPYVLEPVINPNGTQQVKANLLNNKITNYSIRGDFSKYASRIKTTFGFDMEYAVNLGNQILQGRLVKSTNKAYRPGLKANIRLSDFWSVDYRTKGEFSKNQLDNRSGESVLSISQLLKLNFFPNKFNFIGITAEHYYNEFATTTNHIFYADVTWRYSLKKQRIDLEAGVTNIFNQQQYITATFTDFYFFKSGFQIRPRQVLASIKWLF